MNEKLYHLKQEFLNFWHSDKLETMTLEEYTDTKKENSFCYWLEHITRDLGSIVGGSSYKFGIYKMSVDSKTEPASNITNDGVYAWHTKYGNTKEEAFSTIKNIIIKIAKSAQTNSLAIIETIDLGHAYKWKIAFLYSNFNIINIFNRHSLNRVLLGLDLEINESQTIEEINNLIVSKKPQDEDFFTYSARLWKNYGKQHDQAKAFKKWLQENQQIKSGKVTSYLQAINILINYFKIPVYNEGDIEELQLLYLDLKENQKNFNGKYFYEKSPSYGTGGHYSAAINAYLEFLNTHSNSISKIMEQSTTIKVETRALNKILFGPPGTGKTYKIINDYIVSSESHLEKIDTTKQIIDLKKGFWHLAPGEGGYLWGDLKKGDYLGYEYCGHYLGDLSKVSKNESSWDMKRRFSKVKKGDYFCIISGKKFYAVAQADHDYDLSKSKNLNYDFQTIKVKWIKKFEKPELLNTTSTQSFSNLKGSKRWLSLLEAFESQDIYPENKVGKQIKKQVKNYSLVSFHQSFSYEDFIEGIKPDLDDEEGEKKEIRYIIQDGIFKESCDKAARLAGYEDLIACIEDTKEGRKQSFQNASPYYLLIDEINRGNVAAIFGELITLIEKDKRLGKKYELLTKLPYSKKDFGVPANLNIIGTMNTADRSVEALDTALRRRFEFVEKMPDFKVIEHEEVNGVKLSKVLKVINKRIELLIDRDHTIGHSYFVGVDTPKKLTDAFNNKIIPLLQEYFYGDYGKIGLVLGNGFVKEKDNRKLKFSTFKYEGKEEFIMPTYKLIKVDKSTVLNAVEQLLETNES